MKLSKITSLVVFASTLAVGGVHAQFLVGWDFQDTTVGTDLSVGYNAEFVSGVNDAVLTSSTFTTTSGLGSGNSTITGSNDSFWNNNGFEGGAASPNTPGTKSIRSLSDGDSFTIVFDASAASSLGLYTTWADQSGTGFGSINGGVLQEPFTIALDNDGSTTTLAASTLESHNGSAYFDQAPGGLSGDNSGFIDLSFLDGADVATLTFTSVQYTGGGSVNGQNLIIDNIGLSGVGSISVVPEPSAFAALAGVLVLGFAAVRRRR